MSIRAVQFILLSTVVLYTLIFGYTVQGSEGIENIDDELSYLDYMTSETLPKMGNLQFQK